MKNLETYRLTDLETNLETDLETCGKVTAKEGTQSLNFCEGEWCGD